MSEGKISRRRFLEVSGGLFGGLALGHLSMPERLAVAQAVERILIRAAWVYGGYDAPLAVAREHGYFARNIDADFRAGTGSLDVAKLVGLGRDEFGTVSTSVTLVSRSSGIPIKILGLYTWLTPFAIISRKESGIRTPKDLEGRSTTATPGGEDRLLIYPFLRKNGVDVNKVDVKLVSAGSNITVFLEKKVDTALLYSNVHLPILRAHGLDESKLNIVRFSDWGFAQVPHLAFVSSDPIIESKPEVTKRVVEGVYRGIKYAIDHPDEAVDLIMRKMPRANREIVKGQLVLSFQNIDRTKPIGWVDEKRLEFIQDLWFDLKEIKKKLPVKDYYTNEFLTVRL